MTQIFCLFLAIISTGLGDPLGCSDLSQFFFGSSPTIIEWNKIVTEIITTFFVFLRHPIFGVQWSNSHGLLCCFWIVLGTIRTLQRRGERRGWWRERWWWRWWLQGHSPLICNASFLKKRKNIFISAILKKQERVFGVKLSECESN